jgi:hypothetical protein
LLPADDHDALTTEPAVPGEHQRDLDLHRGALEGDRPFLGKPLAVGVRVGFVGLVHGQAGIDLHPCRTAALHGLPERERADHLVREARPLLVNAFVAQVVQVGLSDVGQQDVEFIPQPVEGFKVVLPRCRW